MKKLEKFNFNHNTMAIKNQFHSLLYLAVHFLLKNINFMRQTNNFEIIEINSELEKFNLQTLTENN